MTESQTQSFSAMTRQLAAMVAMQLPLDEGLRILAKTVPSRKMRSALETMSLKVERGAKLSEAAADTEGIIPEYWSRLAAIGEDSSQLGPMLNLAGDIAQETSRLHRKVLQALMYPGIVLALICVNLLVFMFAFTKGFAASSISSVAELRWILGNYNSNQAQAGGMAVLFEVVCLSTIPLVVLYLLPLFVLKMGQGNRFWDRLVIKTPLWGRAICQAHSAIFSRCLQVLISKGIPLHEALELSAEIMPNAVVRDSLNLAAAELETGASLGDALGVYPVFREDFVWALASMEQRGNLIDGLPELVNQARFRTQHALKMFTTMLHPVLLFLVGGGVAFLVWFEAMHTLLLVRILTAIG